MSVPRDIVVLGRRGHGPPVDLFASSDSQIAMVLEDLRPNAAIRGILPDALVTVIAVQWFGSEALELKVTATA